jgi:hypothetical protein
MHNFWSPYVRVVDLHWQSACMQSAPEFALLTEKALASMRCLVACIVRDCAGTDIVSRGWMQYDVSSKGAILLTPRNIF